MPGVAGAMKSFLQSLARNSRGTSAVEYGLICAMIVLVMLVAVQGMGAQNGGTWGSISSKTAAAMSGS
jgi:pilus assembly protein Flp/PilA